MKVRFVVILLIVLVVGIFSYFRLMPSVKEERLHKSVPIRVNSKYRHEIIVAGYTSPREAVLKIKRLPSDLYFIDTNLTTNRKRYSSNGGKSVYYTTAVKSLGQLFEIGDDRDFVFSVEWQFDEDVEIILKSYNR